MEENNNENIVFTVEEYKLEKKQWLYRTILIVVVFVIFATIMASGITYYVTYGERYSSLFKSTSKVRSNSDEPEIVSASSTITDISATLANFAEFIDDKYIGEIDKNELIDSTIKGFVEGIGDEYSEYMTKEEWEEYQADALGNYVGVGIYMSQDDDGNIVIISTIKDTPAERAELKSGDLIIGVDGESTAGMSTSDVSSRVKGEEGTEVTLTIYRDGQSLDFTLKRESVKVYHAESKMLEDEIGYISLLTFDDGCAAELDGEMQNLVNQGAKKVILDLRNNTGGLVDEALEILDLFLDKDTTVLITKSADGTEEISKTKADKKYDVELVVLVNGYSASASEIVTGALKDNGRAKIIGTQTYGKGVIQNVYPLADGGVLKLTTQEYYTPNNTKINKIGITPDYEIELTDEDIENEYDSQLEKAKEILKGE